MAYACFWGHADCVEILLDNGADVNAKDKVILKEYRFTITCVCIDINVFYWFQVLGKTALMRAAQNGHDAVVKVMLRSGASKTLKDVVCNFSWLDSGVLIS